MKFFFTALLVLAASAFTLAKPHKAPLLGPEGPKLWDKATCRITRWPAPPLPTLTNSYVISAVVNESPSRICGRLWHNLSRFRSCGAITKAWCEDNSVEGGDMHLNWGFTLTLLCDPGCVNSAWFEATRNRYGAIDC
ncbi:hypothetical protein CI238_12599 [Colletotrichum incanum]|uniref:Uncharacterized protein n=1 Tax=Colletotrichum incanum TaxID=1573173 RepID=A0A162Q374_COLIC|nr:hypothetical protein CI238_12599 [Colletotrichum incanum]OHW98416.1 hypothetical protein CSPAE12_02835 [Colletotrichum incanum]